MIEPNNGTMRMLKTIGFTLTGLVTLGVLIGMISGYFNYIADVKSINEKVIEINKKLDNVTAIDSRLVTLEYLHGINLPKIGGESSSQTK
jgi:hypothetical protein